VPHNFFLGAIRLDPYQGAVRLLCMM
jgi:hypothetical protein